MKFILEWLKPGAKVKRYILLQIVSIAIMVISIYKLLSVYDMDYRHLIAYISLITLSIFGIVISFIFAQRNILFMALKNLSGKSKNINLRRLLYSNPRLNKGPKVVVIGGGSGLSNILSGLKDYTSNITAIVATTDEGENIEEVIKNNDKLPHGDIRKCIAALSPSEEIVDKLMNYELNISQGVDTNFGNTYLSSMTKVMGSYEKALENISEVFKIKGKILPVTYDKMKLCAGLENGEIVVGQANIKPRVIETKSQVKQIFLKEGGIKPATGVVEAIKQANVIVIGPGNLYTSLACNFLIDEVSKAIISSRAKKILIANIMNQPGETDGYTLARHINEMERYIGKHVIDYVITNSSKITDEMKKDFNQGDSTQPKNDIENIQNRAISVLKEDIVVTSKNSLMHDSKRVANIIMKIAKSKKIGELNVVKIKKKHLKNKNKILNGKSIKNDSLKNNSFKNIIEKIKEVSKKADKTKEATIEKQNSHSKTANKKIEKSNKIFDKINAARIKKENK